MKLIKYFIKSIIIIVSVPCLVLISSFVDINILIPEKQKFDSLPPFLNADTLWVDSVFNSLSYDERLAQLFMIPAYSNKDTAEINAIERRIKKYGVGGIIFMQGGPARQINLINRYQNISKVPLLIASDAEWGLSMRLDSTINWPRQLMLGAIQDDELLYDFGCQIAYECKRTGINVNFAPVLDINNNPLNPVIGYRSFGENKMNVARKGFYYMKGMQDNNILAVGKHFPGHGDTDKDSHLSLPVIKHDKSRLDSVELYPFKQLINHGLGGIMVAHLYIPALDTTKNLATTLSPKVVDQLLKNDLKFQGLIFTDALKMKAVSQYFEPGEVELKALIAGNDVLLFPTDIEKAIEKIKSAVNEGKIKQEEIDKRCKKILMAKYWAGLNKWENIPASNIYSDLNSPQALLLRRKLIEKSITVLKNDSLIPFYRLDTLKIATVAIGTNNYSEFQKTIDLYLESDKYVLKNHSSIAERNALMKKIKERNYNLVIIGFVGTNRIPSRSYGISKEGVDFTESLAKDIPVIIDLFANPYALNNFTDTEIFKAIIISYNNWKITQNISAQILFGGIPASGKIPVRINGKYKEGQAWTSAKRIRFKYTLPEEVGMNGAYLNGKIDSIVNNAIDEGVFPGCQVLVAKDTCVVFHKAYGYHTYDKKQAVKLSDIYDLASITKVAASTISIMKLVEEKKCSIDSTVSKYLPYLAGSDKKDITIKEVMKHQAGLTPWIPYYLYTTKNDSIFNIIYSKTPDSLHNTKVCDNLYILDTYKDTIFDKIVKSKLHKKEYKYSDVGFYWIYQLIGELTATSLDIYVQENFYNKLGATSTGYNPLDRFPIERIVPTEEDDYFRKTRVHGYVHDMGAAMLGGVCGHAGLFSDANDLAKLMQMLLQGGEYGGYRFLSDSIIKVFTKCEDCDKNRRGIGFDKPEMNYDKIGPTCQCVSGKSFGHTGFTGTFAWADPDKNIVYIFLSNRTYPDMKNNKIIEMNVRTKIQEEIYNSLIK
ncbi:MAG: glycoside hydrolase family 3 N-terminal domain-containing protein [Marinilabiliales bacterium]